MRFYSVELINAAIDYLFVSAKSPSEAKRIAQSRLDEFPRLNGAIRLGRVEELPQEDGL